ncbi:MAG: acyl-CoA dehydrogenase [Acidimicrobiia bacterium]|nr:acyl-CoA dehydrogenase [Acidimicrobiia bacterium]
MIDHADVRRMLMTMRAYTEAMRSLTMFTAEAIDLSRHHVDPDIRESKADLVDLLTPVVKAWCTDRAVEVTSLAIQVHGGMGYIEETGVAQYLRDTRITPIYEGTNGIQAMDLVGRKLALKGGEPVRDLLAMMAALDPVLVRAGDEMLSIQQPLGDGISTLIDATTWLFENGLSDPLQALGAATPYLDLFGQVTGGWLLARQALAAHRALGAGGGDEAFLRAKITTARFYMDNLLPLASGQLGAVKSGAAGLFDIATDSF